MNFQDTLLAQGDLIKKLKQRNYNLVVKNESLKEENEQLKQKKNELVHENVKLQNDLFTQELNEDESNYLISKLKKEIVELKTEIVDHRVKEYRLTKILNETSDCT